VAISIVSNPDNTIFSVIVETPLHDNTKYIISLTNVKTKTNQVINAVFDFTTGDFTAPSAAILSPNNGASDISRTPSIQVQFSEAVTDVNSTTITLHTGSPSGTIVALGGITEGDNNTYTFSPSSPLSENTKYYVVLSNGIKDSGGNELTQTEFNFTTGDFTAPSVAILSPNNGASDISRTPSITIQFSEAVTNVNTTTVTLHAESATGTPVALGNIIESANNTYTFSPSASLAANTVYYIVLSNVIKDNANNHLSETDFSFTTETVQVHGAILVGDFGLISNYNNLTASVANIAPPLNTNYGITYADGKFVAVGAQGTIITSTDGTTWALQTSVISDDLFAVAYGNGKFVAVGALGKIITSPDGITWTIQNSSTFTPINGITYANSKFVAVGSMGLVLTSTDGITWTSQNSGNANNFKSITYGSGLFVAVGNFGAIYTSPDGVTWTNQTLGTSADFYGITYGNGTFVTVGNSYGDFGPNGEIYTSPDAITWTNRAFDPGTGYLCVAYANSTFVVGSDNGPVKVSTNNGINWTEPINVPANQMFGVAYGNSTFVGVGLAGSLRTSADNGVTWTVQPYGAGYLNGVSTSAPYFNGLTSNTDNSTFVAVGNNGIIFTSSDRTTWTRQTSGTSENLSGIAYGNGTFVSVGGNGTIRTSTDSVAWITGTSGTSTTLNGITYANSKFVAVGNTGTILTSADGSTWNVQTSGSTVNLYSVTYGNGKYVAVGGNSAGTILTSTDGITWTAQVSGTVNILSGITYADGKFVAVGDSGTILTSTDGISWTVHSSGGSEHLYGVNYASDTFIAIGLSGAVYTSADGVTWTRISSGTYTTFRAVASY